MKAVRILEELSSPFWARSTATPQLPRLTHPGITHLGPYSNTPAGTRVSAFAWCLHRNKDVFPDPEKWFPQRWLNAEGDRFDGGEQERWFWAFGTGSRRRLGQNLALESMWFDTLMRIG